MESRILLYDTEARERLKKGVDALAKMVKVTLGPKGRNVILDKKYGGPLITKDGVTVAKEVFMKDVVENMGAQLIKQVASKTAETAGDGTTSATVLAQAIIHEGIKRLTAGSNPVEIKRGIDLTVTEVVKELKKLSKKVSTKEEIIQVGTISANNDPAIGNLIADAMEKVGNDGVITVETSDNFETYVDFVEGMVLDRGYLSHYFINRLTTFDTVLEKCRVLFYDGNLVNPADLVGILNAVLQVNQSILIIAEDVAGDALKTLIVNRMKMNLPICAIKAPGFGDRRKDILQDIATLTGGVVFNDDYGTKLKNATLQDLGTVEKAIITKDSTTLVGGAGSQEALKERIQQIRNLIDKGPSEFDKQKLEERLAKLAGGVAILRVGAASEAEINEKKARIEDALHATRAAVEEGIVPGGGVAYLRVSGELFSRTDIGNNSEQRLGVDIILKALLSPIDTIVQNAGINGEVVRSTILRDSQGNVNFGYNALTDKFEDLMLSGVIDPTKVVRCALENAASVAGLFLTTEGVVAESPEEKAEFEKLMASQQG
ncbi:MAG: chaperonin GroEL [Candidatus Omnitrophica bacterium]|jgi:chaperonin GroEL|nr:chaperonin GroEL [Candidatus Omnitrophota bacterium]